MSLLMQEGIERFGHAIHAYCLKSVPGGGRGESLRKESYYLGLEPFVSVNRNTRAIAIPAIKPPICAM